MQLWTHHPSHLRLDAPDLVIDPKLGEYWKLQRSDFRYREVLPMLQQRVGTDQFLWCCTVRGEFKRNTEDHDLVEWELNVPQSKIIAFVRVPVWEDIVWDRGGSWDQLILTDIPTAGDHAIHALVAIPLSPEWVTRHGPLRPTNSREVQEEAERILRTPPDPTISSDYDW